MDVQWGSPQETGARNSYRRNRHRSSFAGIFSLNTQQGRRTSAGPTSPRSNHRNSACSASCNSTHRAPVSASTPTGAASASGLNRAGSPSPRRRLSGTLHPNPRPQTHAGRQPVSVRPVLRTTRARDGACSSLAGSRAPSASRRPFITTSCIICRSTGRSPKPPRPCVPAVLLRSSRAPPAHSSEATPQ